MKIFWLTWTHHRKINRVDFIVFERSKLKCNPKKLWQFANRKLTITWCPLSIFKVSLPFDIDEQYIYMPKAFLECEGKKRTWLVCLRTACSACIENECMHWFYDCAFTLQCWFILINLPLSFASIRRMAIPTVARLRVNKYATYCFVSYLVSTGNVLQKNMCIDRNFPTPRIVHRRVVCTRPPRMWCALEENRKNYVRDIQAYMNSTTTVFWNQLHSHRSMIRTCKIVPPAWNIVCVCKWQW